MRLETAGARDFGPCTCCGHNSRKVWGYLHAGDCTEAAYVVEWTLGRVAEHGAHFDFIIGEWGDDASSAQRVSVSLEFRRTPQGPQFMVIDSATRSVAKNELVGCALSRAEVMGTPLAERVFSFVDAVWLGDGRIGEIRGEAAEHLSGPRGSRGDTSVVRPGAGRWGTWRRASRRLLVPSFVSVSR